ncbi:LysR substrate-binding domain-containing protein [Corynebacterium halotolerans]|uniref:LysR substrate-binding domain-containing protein n=1 Tax=Corynebacterium halotolerans TaxID=225326 RepID=UPI003CF10C2B
MVTATSATPPSTDPRFEQRPLLADPLDLIVPAAHAFAGRDRVDLADAADEAWIVGRLGSAYHHLVVAACTSAGFSPDIAHWADEWETGTALVSHGFGIMLVPRLARLHPHWPVARVPLQGEPTPARRILAATRRGSSDNLLVEQALTKVTETARTLSPAVVPLQGHQLS